MTFSSRCRTFEDTVTTAGSAAVDRAESRESRVHLLPLRWNKRCQSDIRNGEWEQRAVRLPA